MEQQLLLLKCQLCFSACGLQTLGYVLHVHGQVIEYISILGSGMCVIHIFIFVHLCLSKISKIQFLCI